jgi:uncharacterized membrane protein YqgA involved in biofilm formation
MTEYGVLFTGVGVVAAVVGSHVRLETRFNELAERFKRVEKVVGLNGSPPAFVRASECALLMEKSKTHDEG